MDRTNDLGSLAATITAVLVLTGTIGVLYPPVSSGGFFSQPRSWAGHV
jgi:hypothetical protein